MNNKIKLRALEPEDLEFLYKLENNQNLWHLSQTQQPFSKYLLKQYIEQADKDIYEVKQFRFAIELIENNTIIGFIDLFDFDPKNKRAGIGIIIYDENLRGKGLGSKSISKIIDYANNVLYLHQLYANISADNLTSIQLFKKMGFQLIGQKKDWNYNGNNYTDELMFQLILNK